MVSQIDILRWKKNEKDNPLLFGKSVKILHCFLRMIALTVVWWKSTHVDQQMVIRKYACVKICMQNGSQEIAYYIQSKDLWFRIDCRTFKLAYCKVEILENMFT